MKNSLEKFKISSNLMRLRKENGISTTEVSKVLGMSRQGYNSIENGRSVLTLENAVALAKYYGISIEELIQVPNSHSSSSNECAFPSYLEEKDGRIEETNEKILVNFGKTKYVFTDCNQNISFFESTVTPCFGKEMLFYYKDKLQRAVIYRNTATSFSYFCGDTMISASFKKTHFLAVKIEINDLFL